ncbi:RNAse (barnase) inhibitor barstar [Nocardioides albertanoniae]|uniref:RNAse (Barnase) inhibitor barstar n=1 Tax=Nocardioides albertanoniae TaxID=1175486 RepID=A0A543A9M5_9ACTN|nr:barstar family protein [Nocardioides albertanoniae]TQL69249.1 RNAse (barnase) inhibitor barstar [Nocardioides albertanoniae]
MSGLAGLLAGRIEPGVYRWHAESAAADLTESVAVAGWSLAQIREVAETKADVLGAIGTALGFPSHFGRNLDALWDSLRDLSAPTVLLWETWGAAAYADRAGFDKILGVLRDRAAEISEDRPAFTVLLRGDGPETDLAELG